MGRFKVQIMLLLKWISAKEKEILSTCVKRVTGQYSWDHQREYYRRGGTPLTDTSLKMLYTLYEKLGSREVIIISPQEDVKKHNGKKKNKSQYKAVSRPAGIVVL